MLALTNPVIFNLQNVENLSPQIIRRVVKELNDLVDQPPEGIKITINDEDVTDIQAYIEGPGKHKPNQTNICYVSLKSANVNFLFQLAHHMLEEHLK